MSGVRSCWLDPSASMIQILLGRLAKTIFVPSGDQFGSPSTRPPVGKVSCCWFEPSAFITHIPALLTKTIFVPSGDQHGSVPPFVVSLLRTDPVLASATKI